MRALRAIAPVLPYEVVVTELRAGERFALPGGLVGSCERGEHALPVLAYRADLMREQGFLPERARALGVPMRLWSRLQAGESVSWEGGHATPDEVLGPPRPGLCHRVCHRYTPGATLSQFLEGVDLLVCEGTYGSDEDLPKAVRNRHMTFREAATLARDASAKRPLDHALQPGVRRPGGVRGECHGRVSAGR